jgi:hypothetical protein
MHVHPVPPVHPPWVRPCVQAFIFYIKNPKTSPCSKVGGDKSFALSSAPRLHLSVSPAAPPLSQTIATLSQVTPAVPGAEALPSCWPLAACRAAGCCCCSPTFLEKILEWISPFTERDFCCGANLTGSDRFGLEEGDEAGEEDESRGLRIVGIWPLAVRPLRRRLRSDKLATATEEVPTVAGGNPRIRRRLCSGDEVPVRKGLRRLEPVAERRPLARRLRSGLEAERKEGLSPKLREWRPPPPLACRRYRRCFMPLSLPLSLRRSLSPRSSTCKEYLSYVPVC